jgi:hypothetical protein
MQFREVITVQFQTHVKYVNTLCRNNAGLFTIKASGTYGNHWAPDN